MPLGLCETKGYGRETEISCLKSTWKTQNDISYLLTLILVVHSLMDY